METAVSAVDLALDWQVNSDVRVIAGDPIALGGVSRGYDWQQRSYPYIYCEVTGYAVSLLVNAYRWTGAEGFLALAGQSADFLLRMQRLAVREGAQGSIFHSLSLPELEPCHQYYSFDAAMCLQGILDLESIRSSPELRCAARKVGDWLVDRMQGENGGFLSMFDAGTGQWQHPGEEFFNDYGCLHAKHAIPLLRLARLTGDEKYAQAAQKVCDWVLSLQDEDGGFRANTLIDEVVSHPHCYAIEGLLYAHSVLGTERYLEAARQAARWLLKAQNRDGSISIAYKQDWRHLGRRMPELVFPRRVTDATAQALRIWLAFSYLDGDPAYLRACLNAEKFLQGMQCVSSPDQNAIGAFYFWPGHPIMFTWCTQFAAHALYALANRDREDGYQVLMGELF
jgi:hypothetical protein